MKKFLIALNVILLILININNEVLGHTPNDLHYKKNVDSIGLDNANNFYGVYKALNFEKQKATDGFLKKDIIFKNQPIKTGEKSDLLIHFDTEEKANYFFGKEVDIFSVSFQKDCYGGEVGNTYCGYGGVTLSKDNKLPETKKITIDLNIDDKHSERIFGEVKTDKKEATIQEIDYQVKRYLANKYNVYRASSNIQRGYIRYFTPETGYVDYDIYDIKGKFAQSFLQIYDDNKTIKTKNLVIKTNLYTN